MATLPVDGWTLLALVLLAILGGMMVSGNVAYWIFARRRDGGWIRKPPGWPEEWLRRGDPGNRGS